MKTAHDYRVLHRAFEDTRYTAAPELFTRAEAELGDNGITLGTLGWAPLRRTPLLQVQIDFAGPEQFALDLADEAPELMDLLELLTELTLDKLREAVKTPAHYIKLWENLAIEMIGPRHYRRHIVPVYRHMFDILGPAGKRLLVHYDGKLKVIADDIAQVGLRHRLAHPITGRRHVGRRGAAPIGPTSSCGCTRPWAGSTSRPRRWPNACVRWPATPDHAATA